MMKLLLVVIAALITIQAAAAIDPIMGFPFDTNSDDYTGNNQHFNTTLDVDFTTPAKIGAGAAKLYGNASSYMDQDGIVMSDENFSIMFWVNIGDESTTQGIMNTLTSSSSREGFSLTYDSGDDGFRFFTFASNSVQVLLQFPPAGGVQNNTWYHIAITCEHFTGNTTHTCNSYLNSVFNDTENDDNFQWGTGSQPLMIGRNYHTGSYQDFDGSIDQLEIFDAVIPLSRIQAHYNNGTGINNLTLPTTTAEYAYYPFENDFDDAGPRNNDLVNNSVYLDTNNSIVGNGSAYFAGITNETYAQSSFKPSDYNFTIDTWVMIENETLTNGIATTIESHDVTRDGWYMTKDLANDEFRFFTFLNDVFQVYLQMKPTGGVESNEWYHIVVSCEYIPANVTHNCRGYLNGEYKDSESDDAFTTHDEDLRLGHNTYHGTNQRYLHGWIDNFRIHNYTVDCTGHTGYNTSCTGGYVYEAYNNGSIVTNTEPNTTKYPANTTITINVNTPTTFNVTATDADNDTLTYQWYTNSTPIGGATSNAYTYATNLTTTINLSVVTDDNTTNVTDYWIVTSIDEPPNITGQNPSQNVNLTEGQTETFSVTVNDPESRPLYYAYYLDGNNTVNTTTYQRTFGTAGVYNVSVQISDGTNIVGTYWTVNVSAAPPTGGYNATYVTGDVVRIIPDGLGSIGVVIVAFAGLIGIFLLYVWLKPEFKDLK